MKTGMKARTSSETCTGNDRAVIETRIAFDAAISCLARKLYIALCGAGAWARPIAVRTSDYATRFGVSREAIRAALRQLDDNGYVRRIVRPGARTQQVQATIQAVGSVVGKTNA